jgi:hypothetical protein
METVASYIKYDFLKKNLQRARNRDNAQEIKITVDQLMAIGDQQGWLCALTGRPLEFVRGGTHWGGKWCNPWSCTIDRLDNEQGYVPGNVQLVTWYANKTKGFLNNDEFINLCESVIKHAK